MRKSRVLFIIDIVLSSLSLIGFGFLAYIVFKYLGENTNKEIVDRLGYSFAIMLIGIIRVVITILLLCLNKKRGFVKVFRFVSIPFLCILSSIGAFIICASDNKENNIVTTKKTIQARILIIIGILFSALEITLAIWYSNFIWEQAFKKLNLGVAFFMLIIIVIAYLPLAYFCVGLYAEIMLLFIKPNTKFFKIIKIITISTLCIFAYIGINIIENEQLKQDNNNVSFEQ